MSDLSKLEGGELVACLTSAELEIVHAASQIHGRVFNITSVTKRLPKTFSDSTVYAAIRHLDEGGIFMVHANPQGREMKDKVIEVSFTPRGRSICAMVKEQIEHLKGSAPSPSPQQSLL